MRTEGARMRTGGRACEPKTRQQAEKRAGKPEDARVSWTASMRTKAACHSEPQVDRAEKAHDRAQTPNAPAARRHPRRQSATLYPTHATAAPLPGCSAISTASRKVRHDSHHRTIPVPQQQERAAQKRWPHHLDPRLPGRRHRGGPGAQLHRARRIGCKRHPGGERVLRAGAMVHPPDADDRGAAGVLLHRLRRRQHEQPEAAGKGGGRHHRHVPVHHRFGRHHRHRPCPGDAAGRGAGHGVDRARRPNSDHHRPDHRPDAHPTSWPP